MGHTIHAALPSGFTYADEHQSEQFAKTGSVNGASKVCLVLAGNDSTDTDLAIRLRPPRTLADIESELGVRAVTGRRNLAIETLTDDEQERALAQYVLDYNAGWTAAGRKGEQAAWDSGNTPYSWDDGFLDRIAGRAKWHTAYCEYHTDCPEGAEA